MLIIIVIIKIKKQFNIFIIIKNILKIKRFIQVIENIILKVNNIASFYILNLNKFIIREGRTRIKKLLN
jgi:hypothetical protein